MSTKLTFRESIVLAEAREKDNPNINYTEKIAKNEIVKVIAELEKSESGVFTKLARRFWRLNEAIKRMEAKAAELEPEIREKCEGLFDAGDLVRTRVVATAKFVITLNKKVEQKTPDPVIDYKSIVAELTLLIPAELEEKVKEITVKYTQAKKEQQPARKVGMKVKPKDPNSEEIDEALAEGVITDILGRGAKAFKKMVDAFLKSITKWAVKFDDRLNALKIEAGIS